MTIPYNLRRKRRSSRLSDCRTEKTIGCPNARTRMRRMCLVAGKNRFDLYRIGMDEPFFFHPNSAAFRLKAAIEW